MIPHLSYIINLKYQLISTFNGQKRFIREKHQELDNFYITNFLRTCGFESILF